MTNLQRSCLVVGVSFLAAAMVGYWVPWRALLGRGKGAPVRRANDPAAGSVVASDPHLLEPARHVIRDAALAGPSETGQAAIPYLIELADGRFVFGKTDDAGRTRSVYTDELVAHRTTWGDDAVVALDRRQRQAQREADGAPRAGNRPTTPVHRWRDMMRDMDADHTHVPATRPRRFVPSSGASNGNTPFVPCKVAVSGNSPVADACVRGGLSLAKRTMKELVKTARENGYRFTCEGCHKDLDGFELVSDAREQFRALLQATGAGAAAR